MCPTFDRGIEARFRIRNGNDHLLPQKPEAMRHGCDDRHLPAGRHTACVRSKVVIASPGMFVGPISACAARNLQQNRTDPSTRVECGRDPSTHRLLACEIPGKPGSIATRHSNRTPSVLIGRAPGRQFRARRRGAVQMACKQAGWRCRLTRSPSSNPDEFFTMLRGDQPARRGKKWWGVADRLMRS